MAMTMEASQGLTCTMMSTCDIEPDKPYATKLIFYCLSQQAKKQNTKNEIRTS